ncbi:MAG: alpha/beta hydrolase, partial [Planctomycetota bacterium]
MPRITHCIALLIASGLLAMGCSRQVLMPTPAIVSTAGVGAHMSAVDAFQSTEVQVFVAAPRKVREREDSREIYTKERANIIHLGRATMQIGRELGWERVLEASKQQKRRRQPVIEFESYEPYGYLWASVPGPLSALGVDWYSPDVARDAGDRWVKDIEAQLDVSMKRRIFIFVHGFNTQFAKNLGIAAEYWHFMSRDGAMISYAWPSQGNVFAYQQDKANADYATRKFRQLLLFLAEHTSVEEINILAHSAGCPIVIESLRDI